MPRGRPGDLGIDSRGGFAGKKRFEMRAGGGVEGFPERGAHTLRGLLRR